MTRQTLDEGANMLPSTHPACRAIAGAIGTGALAGAMLFGAAVTATAQPPTPTPAPAPAPEPPACTAAELALVMSGVTFQTSTYLTLHPDVNDFFTSLKGQPKDQISAQVQTYLDANPQIRADLQGIREPSVAFRQRCGVPETP